MEQKQSKRLSHQKVTDMEIGSMTSQETSPPSTNVSACEFQQYLHLIDKEISKCHRFNKIGANAQLGWLVINTSILLLSSYNGKAISTALMTFTCVVLVIPLIFHLDSMFREFRLQIAKAESTILFKRNSFERAHLTVTMPTLRRLTWREYGMVYRSNRRYLISYLGLLIYLYFFTDIAVFVTSFSVI